MRAEPLAHALMPRLKVEAIAALPGKGAVIVDGREDVERKLELRGAEIRLVQHEGLPRLEIYLPPVAGACGHHIFRASRDLPADAGRVVFIVCTTPPPRCPTCARWRFAKLLMSALCWRSVDDGETPLYFISPFCLFHVPAFVSFCHLLPPRSCCCPVKALGNDGEAGEAVIGLVAFGLDGIRFELRGVRVSVELGECCLSWRRASEMRAWALASSC